MSFGSSADENVEANIVRGLHSLQPDVEITAITPTPIDNIYQVMIGADVVYMTGDGRYAFKGDLLDLESRRNLSEEERSIARIDILEKLPEKDLIEFAPEKTEHAIYVFTDVDCSYCRRLHRDVPELNRNGIAVRYLAFPRGGVNSPAFRNMVSVWCAKDRQQALTDAKNGKSIKSSDCANPVSKQYQIGRDLGIRGTPAIYLENGTELPGYMPPKDLVRVVKR
jgi:thiol:disulfide interchange protein DsbC